ncbi:LPXTG cell wall anchor domain-containing protein [Streptodolium elevatio]|uniref:LPXTG cell wall anchor domain-containing protein n=1 Tax=Streptodolium elevatio TaxID=3157996 RepID=A0ABV3DF46_9ACTN
MQLRRSLAVTAVTALASSAALFAAPAAFADETTTPTPTATATATKDATATTTPTATATATATGSPSAAAPGAETPAAKTPSATPTQAAAPELPPAGTVIPNDQKGDQRTSVTFGNFPAKLVPGAAAKEFSAIVKNNTGKAIDVSPEIYLQTVGGTLRAEHVKLEYLRDGKWQTAKLANVDSEGNAVFGVIGGGWNVDDEGYYMYESPYTVGKNATLDVKVRVSLTASAPLGVGVGVLGSVAWVNDEEFASVESQSDFYVFHIVKTDDAPKPADNGTKPKPKPKPTKPGAELAETGGDDSSATTIAIVGGVALVGGAGLLVVMRRRKGDGAAAA